MDELERRVFDAIERGDVADLETLAAAVDAANPPKAQVSLLQAALYYASIGLPVFPLQPGTKIPHPGTHGCKDATTDEATVRAWWDRWPNSNVAIATGHAVDVVDIDGTEGHKSRSTHWDDIFAKVDADSLGKVLTPRPGGMHIYVPATGDGNSTNIVPKVDYRGQGGYVVAPPSAISDEWAAANDATAGPYLWLGTPRIGTELGAVA